jgi:hypothetical protein
VGVWYDLVGTINKHTDESILQHHWETDRFFSTSGVQFAQLTSGLVHFHRVVFSSQLKVKVGYILVKPFVFRVNLNIDWTPVSSKSHKTLVSV